MKSSLSLYKNNIVLNKDNHIFLFISSNKTDLLLYCNSLEHSPNFKKVEEIYSIPPLDAIIFLHHGSRDYIGPLSPRQQLSLLLSECDINVHDKNAIRLAIRQMTELIQKSPVFILHYNTPENSIKLLYDYLHI